MDKEYWFTKKQQQFLKNIDTFYYSVKLYNDFLGQTEDIAVLNFRKVVNEFRSGKDGQAFFATDYTYPAKVDPSYSVIFRQFTFSRFYNFCLEKPDFFDIFVASEIPAYSDGENKTPEIIIQLRSRCLWEKGVYQAFTESMEFVSSFCAGFGFKIKEVHENRCDFACHTNYIQNPERFFSQKNFFNMQVSAFKDKFSHDTLYKDRYESDYISLGRRGDKVFLRIYLKTKEVVQEGYKGYFLKLWQLSGMISNYDFYCLEAAYKVKNWHYLDIARLKWSLQYDDCLSASDREDIEKHISVEKPDYGMIHKIADKFTHPVTKIMNIEFQTMYKMSKSFELIHFKDNTGITSRVYDYLDNYILIYDYLTSRTFRLVRTDQTDTNKSRRDNIEFWDRLRRAKIIDIKKRADIKLLRKYSTKLDLEIRKKKAMHAVSGFAHVLNGNTDNDFAVDCSDLISMLNDNDIKHAMEYKEKISKYDSNDLPECVERYRCVMFYDIDRSSYFYDGDIDETG